MQKAVQELPPRSRPKYLLSADDSRDHLTLFALTFVAGFAADRPRFFGAGAGASAGSVSAVAAALLPVLLSPPRTLPGFSALGSALTPFSFWYFLCSARCTLSFHGDSAMDDSIELDCKLGT